METEDSFNFNPYGTEHEFQTYDLEKQDYNLKKQFGTFDYMPNLFQSLKTKDFGMVVMKHDEEGKLLENIPQHPFFKLKEISMNELINMSDRMQAVRYMCAIPYLDKDKHCLEAVENIIFDTSFDIYQLYYFFSNNEKDFKLTDYIVHTIHPLFFVKGLERGYPFELLIRSARYILSFYSTDTDIRQTILDWLLDIVDDKNELYKTRTEAADVLITCGEPDEIEYGYKIISEIGFKDTFYESEENVHFESMHDSSKNIIRALRSDPSIDYKELVSIDMIYKIIEPFITSIEDKQVVQNYFLRIQTDPTRFERLTLLDIFYLIYRKIKALSKESERNENILALRLYQEIIESADTCFTGYLIRMFNVIQGFVKEKEFLLRMDPKDEIRSIIFSRLNSILQSLSEYQQGSILESIESDNKEIVSDFIYSYDIKEELWEEYKDLLSEEEFNIIYNKTIQQYIGN
jgi:hypothetical protein